MNPYAIQAANLTDLINEMGPTDCPSFTIGGSTYFIIPGSLMMNEELRAGGFSGLFDISFTTPVAQLGTNLTPAQVKAKLLPAVQFTYLGTNFKTTTIDILAGGTIVRINGNYINQNA